MNAFKLLSDYEKNVVDAERQQNMSAVDIAKINELHHSGVSGYLQAHILCTSPPKKVVNLFNLTLAQK